MPIIDFEGVTPKFGQDVFVAPDAWLIGRVVLGNNTTVLFGAVLRGDIEQISIGNNSNVQEHSVFHTSHGFPCTIGSNVTIGHGVILHSCSIGDSSLIGMGSTILDGASIGKNCIIGANSLVSMNMKIPDGSMVYGSPAKVIRPLKQEELEHIASAAKHYVEKGKQYILIFGKAG